MLQQWTVHFFNSEEYPPVVIRGENGRKLEESFNIERPLAINFRNLLVLSEALVFVTPGCTDKQIYELQSGTERKYLSTAAQYFKDDFK